MAVADRDGPAGFTMRAVTTSLAITGMVEGELLVRNMQRPDAAALTWVPNARLAFGRERDTDADFELVVRSMLDGVHARLRAEVEVELGA